jgi:hypothetical protein
VTPKQIAAALSDAPSDEDIQRMRETMRGNLGNLSRREGVAAFHAAIDIALEIAAALGAGDDHPAIIASFLLRECGADVAEAQRAVRRAKANVDAEVAAIKRKAAAS